MILLTTTDFEAGELAIAQTNETTALLQTYIDKYEEVYIKRILGVTLGQLFIDDVQGVDSDSSAIESRFQILIDGFIKQDSSDRVLQSRGMKDILMAIVYYFFIGTTQIKHSQSGTITNSAEVSNILDPENALRSAESKWNDRLSDIEATQWWVGAEDEANYPEYNGEIFKPRYSPLL